MPDIVPATAAPVLDTPPAAPVVPPVAAPVPTQEKLSSKLSKLLMTPTEDVTEPKKVDPVPAEPAKEPAAAAPADKPIKVKKAPKQPEETPPPIPKRSDLTAPAPAVRPAEVATKTPAEDQAAFESDLVDEERALLDDAREAEKHLGDKYKGQAAKVTAFLKEVGKKTSDPEFDENDPEFQRWYTENLPKISPLDFRQIERARVKEDVSKEFEPQLEAERQARWSESEQPKIKAKGNAIYNKLINDSIPDEFARAIAERAKGVTDRGEYVKIVEAVEKDFALEKEIMESIVTTATNDLEEFHRITTVNSATQKPLTALAPDAQIWNGQKFVPNLNATTEAGRQHARLLGMVEGVCNEFKASGGAALKKDGKWFATREEWADMAPSQRAPFWTFSNEEIIQRAMGNIKGAVSGEIQRQRDHLEKRYGFTRRASAAPAAAAPAPTPASGAPPAPRPNPSPAAGAGGMTTSLARSLAARLASPSVE